MNPFEIAALVIFICLLVVGFVATVVVLCINFSKPLDQVIKDATINATTDFINSRVWFDMLNDTVYNESAKIFAEKGMMHKLRSRESFNALMEKEWHERQKEAIKKS